VDKDPHTGKIRAVHCTYDPETKSGTAPLGRKVKGTIHWVSSKGVKATVRLYQHLLLEEADAKDFLSSVNPRSLQEISYAIVEPSLSHARKGDHYQFERLGYFFVDPKDTTQDHLVFNRVVSLKDSFAKKAQAK
jgi:glutaminyl-tRNA synthetase